jgi:hypothetical protein
MLLHLPIAILATFSPITVSDTVPKFDTVRECSFEGGPSVDVARCSRDEAAALRQLQEAWARYTGAKGLHGRGDNRRFRELGTETRSGLVTGGERHLESCATSSYGPSLDKMYPCDGFDPRRAHK